jgi:hypothetical protein
VRDDPGVHQNHTHTQKEHRNQQRHAEHHVGAFKIILYVIRIHFMILIVVSKEETVEIFEQGNRYDA